MKKIGPTLAIFSGLLTGIFAILGLLVARGIIANQTWLGDYTNQITSNAKLAKIVATTMYGILIGVGFVQLILGIFAWKNSRGFAAFVLLGLFVTAIVFAVIAGIQSKSWPTANIITLSINSVAAAGLLFGIFAKK